MPEPTCRDRSADRMASEASRRTPHPSRPRGTAAAWATAATFSLGLVAAAAGLPTPAAAEFAIRSRDRVLVLGDENASAVRGTGPTGFFEYLANYSLLRFPGAKLEFATLGVEGGTAESLEAEVAQHLRREKANVLILVVGMHDLLASGTTLPTPTELAARQATHVAAVSAIVDTAVGLGVRAYVCSYPVTSTGGTIYGDPALHDQLEDFGAAARAAAVAHGGVGIDLTTPTRATAEAMRQAHDWDVSDADGFRLNERGHMAAAYALLTALGAPSEVSSVAISVGATGARVDAASGASVTGATWSQIDRRLQFVRSDQGLPFAVPFFTEESMAGTICGTAPPSLVSLVGFEGNVNRYVLKVTGLPAGTYSVKADGRSVGRFSASALAQGLNLAHRRPAYCLFPDAGGPWDAQALQLHEITRAGLVEREVVGVFLGWLPGRDSSSGTHVPAPDIYRSARKITRVLAKLQQGVLLPQPYAFTVEP
jgi:hypothetical protein